MSASVTSWSSITNPPWSSRLWATNWRTKSASAGPGQATQPSASRKRRCRSRDPSLRLTGSTEVDHPRIDAVLVQDRHAARTRGDVVHLRGEHHRRHQHHRGAGGAFAFRVVVAELVDAILQGDVVGRGLLARVEATEARNLERILRGCPEASDRPGDRFRQ